MTRKPLSTRRIMARAWAMARAAAARFGGRAAAYLAVSLRLSWAEERAQADRIAAMRERVMAETAKIIAEAAARKAAAACANARVVLPKAA